MTGHFLGVRRSTFLFVLTASLCTFDGFLGFGQNSEGKIDKPDHRHHHHYEQLAKVPQIARDRPNPLERDRDAVAAGRKLFSEHCAECHGTTAEGGKKAPNLRAEEVKGATPGTLFWIISNGVVRRGMPVWSKLPEPERWQIVAFIKSLPPAPASLSTETHSHAHSTAETRSYSDDLH